jgi:hypothetical protein
MNYITTLHLIHISKCLRSNKLLRITNISFFNCFVKISTNCNSIMQYSSCNFSLLTFDHEGNEISFQCAWLNQYVICFQQEVSNMQLPLLSTLQVEFQSTMLDMLQMNLSHIMLHMMIRHLSPCFF